MNANHLTLFNSSYDYVAAQASHRDISEFKDGKKKLKNELIAEILWHDAYYAGRDDARKEGKPANEVSASQRKKEEPTVKYMISFAEDDGSTKVLRMSYEQERLLDFLIHEYCLDEHLNIRAFEEYEVIDI